MSRRKRRAAASDQKRVNRKHGDMHDRIRTVVEALIVMVARDDLPIRPPIDLELRGHPLAMRHFAVCFTNDRRGEIELLEPIGPGPHYRWRTIPVFDVGGDDAPKDRIRLFWWGEPVIEFMVDGPIVLSDHEPADGHGVARRKYAAAALEALH